MRQLNLDLARPEAAPFAGVLAGANAVVLASLRDDPWPGPPVYLWGPAGAGKTRLLRETRERAVSAGLGAQWFDPTTPVPWALAEDTALVLLDGAQAWDADRQQGAFSLYVEAAGRVGAAAVSEPPPGARLGVQFVAAGRLPPVDLDVRDDLRTRLAWGPVHALQPLGEADARAALRQEAARHGLVLSDEVLDYLLSRFSRDLKTLMALQSRLGDFALAEKRAVTIPLLKRMLDEGA